MRPIIRPRVQTDYPFSLACHRERRQARERAFRRRRAVARFVHDLMEPEMTFLLIATSMVAFIALSLALAAVHQV